MKIEIAESTEILVFSGPECSGKTTSAGRIAKKYHLPQVKEYARAYLAAHGLEYTFEDILKMALKQIEQEKYADLNHPLIICDTDLVTLEIWSLEVFGKSLGLKDELLRKKQYLLCYPDIPWEPDPLRENPEDRLRLFDRYEAYLIEFGVPFTVLREGDRKNLQLIF